MPKFSVVLFDSDTNMKYYLGEVMIQEAKTVTTFTASFEISAEKFQVYETTVNNKLPSRSIFDETNRSPVKVKKPKKSTRKS